ncbi:MAG: SRA-YDG domain-containing protein [Actinobacteria bacterium]|nr:SRA-YDG domain-containing protein [Actinomycetota bacterium]
MGFDVVELASSRHFGHIPQIPVGTVFANRIEASIAGVHRPRQAGISGAGDGGADSIVVSGGYIDDQDFGSRIIYTGHGGNDPASRRQVADQELERGNLALAVSCDQQIPVRVLRGAGGDPAFSPTSGFRYDGLFKVVRYWPENGVDGFRIWRFELQQLDDSPFVISVPPIGNDLPERRPTAPRNQIVRDPRLSDWVKRLHNWTCQFCGDRLATPAGAYAEAAHIRPLGTPHNGPDQTSNLLCLCPNCHKRFDTFARFVDENGQIVDTTTANVCGHLRTHSEHHIEESNFDYHRRQARML